MVVVRFNQRRGNACGVAVTAIAHKLQSAAAAAAAAVEPKRVQGASFTASCFIVTTSSMTDTPTEDALS